MDLDLHLHSHASDGTVSPTQVVEHALAARLDVIALTDHDTASGVAEARERAKGESLQVLAGIEVSCTWGEAEIHVLGYGFDPTDRAIRAHEGWAGDRRRARMEGMVDRLREQGLEVTMEAVRATAGSDETTLARPHLARALEEAGYVDSSWEAFDRYIGNEHPAYIPTRLLPVEEGISLIHDAGGIAVWAHPPTEYLGELLPVMVDAGLDGLEVYRPRTAAKKIRLLESHARTSGLLMTGGSDWHGPERGELGEFRLSAREISPFLEAIGL
ncbi:MAG: PHP domain-containing protein [Gemmatimonadales bacterium]|nr:MAG: PHP domain-containing protein [Gemmatimonadales bacterium]